MLTLKHTGSIKPTGSYRNWYHLSKFVYLYLTMTCMSFVQPLDSLNSTTINNIPVGEYPSWVPVKCSLWITCRKITAMSSPIAIMVALDCKVVWFCGAMCQLLINCLQFPL